MTRGEIWKDFFKRTVLPAVIALFLYRVGKNLLDFQIPLRDTEEGRWSEWIHTKS